MLQPRRRNSGSVSRRADPLGVETERRESVRLHHICASSRISDCCDNNPTCCAGADCRAEPHRPFIIVAGTGLTRPCSGRPRRSYLSRAPLRPPLMASVGPAVLGRPSLAARPTDRRPQPTADRRRRTRTVRASGGCAASGTAPRPRHLTGRESPARRSLEHRTVLARVKGVYKDAPLTRAARGALGPTAAVSPSPLTICPTPSAPAPCAA